jgi:Na+-translocating ferredoxin:NAD+ oxidoreductase RnfD subunit
MNSGNLRLPALRRFAVAISVLNLTGHTCLGFEQSWAQLVVAVSCAYATELLLEWIGARATGRKPDYSGGLGKLADFLLPAHITGLAVSMLLYANDRVLPFAFAAVVGIASKSIFRVKVGGHERHVLNPSNTGIVATLVAFAWVGISPPYAFTENVAGVWDWVIPGLICCSGTFLNGKFTGRLPLITSWMIGFAGQALLRATLFHTPLAAGLGPMTGMAFLLFSFYMASDPGTTPHETGPQIVFGLLVAAVYSLLQMGHMVFGLFFALFIACAIRGVVVYGMALSRQRMLSRVGESRLDEAA